MPPDDPVSEIILLQFQLPVFLHPIRIAQRDQCPRIGLVSIRILQQLHGLERIRKAAVNIVNHAADDRKPVVYDADEKQIALFLAFFRQALQFTYFFRLVASARGLDSVERFPILFSVHNPFSRSKQSFSTPQSVQYVVPRVFFLPYYTALSSKNQSVGKRKNLFCKSLAEKAMNGGDCRARTCDLLLVRQMLSQLS